MLSTGLNKKQKTETAVDVDMDGSLEMLQNAIDTQLSQLETTVNEVLQQLSSTSTTATTTDTTTCAAEEEAFQQDMEAMLKEVTSTISSVEEMKKRAFTPVLNAHRDSLKHMLSATTTT